MEINLSEVLIKTQEKDKNAMMQIIEKFKPLFKKYAYKLNYDGADSDLMISFIKLIKNIPILKDDNLKTNKELESYICVAMKNEYIRLSKKYSSISKNEMMCEEFMMNSIPYNDMSNDFIVKDLLEKLPGPQKQVLEGIFISGFKEVDIAKKLNITKQAVNKNKKRGLETLKRYICNNSIII